MVNFYSNSIKKINHFLNLSVQYVVDVSFVAPLIPRSAAVEWSSVPRRLVVPLDSS